MEIYEARARLRKELRESLGNSRPQMVRYLEQFPRDVDVWLSLIDLTGKDDLSDVFELALDRCRKSNKLWRRYLELLVEPDIQDCVDAIGRNWDSGPIIKYIEGRFRPDPELMRDCMNSDSRPSELYDLRKPFENSSDWSIEKYRQYIDFLTDRSYHEEAESVCQRLIFDFNDYPESWITYAEFIVKVQDQPDKAEAVLLKACRVFAPWNYYLKFQCGQFFLSILPHRTDLGLELIDEVANECMFDLELIHELTVWVPQRARQYLEQMICRFNDSEGVDFLRLMLLSHDESNRERLISEIINSVLTMSNDRLLDMTEVVPFCYAIVYGSDTTEKSLVHKVLYRNSGLISELFRSDEWPELFPTDEVGRPAPPRPITKAPPKPVTSLERQERAAKRALPGYTPGWLAAQYAKRHNI
jgi:hypothetical protein